MTSSGPGDPVYDKLVGMAARLDVMLARMDDMIRDVSDHETRLRQLEQSRWPVANVSVLVGIAALVVAVLVALYKK